MYEFHRVSESRRAFYHIPQQSLRIKNVGQYFYTFTRLVLQEILGKLGGVLYSVLMVRDTERLHILDKTATTANPHISLGLSPASPSNHALNRITAVPWHCPPGGELQTSSPSLTCPIAPLPRSTLQQQQGLNVCVCFQRKELPRPLLKVPGFPLPTHTSTGDITPLGPLHQAPVCLQEARPEQRRSEHTR